MILKDIANSTTQIVQLVIKHPITMALLLIISIIYYFRIESKELIFFIQSTSHNLSEIITLIS